MSGDARTRAQQLLLVVDLRRQACAHRALGAQPPHERARVEAVQADTPERVR